MAPRVSFFILLIWIGQSVGTRGPGGGKARHLPVPFLGVVRELRRRPVGAAGASGDGGLLQAGDSSGGRTARTPARGGGG